jgi:alpha-mannosidase
VTLFNPSSTAFTGMVALPDGFAAARVKGGDALPTQTEGGTTVARVRVPPRGFVVLEAADPGTEAAPSPTAELVLENELVRYEFSEHLELLGAIDKEDDREILPSGERGNLLSLYEDRPHAWDAWDVDEFYENELLETARGGTVQRISGPARQGLVAELRIGNSTLRQSVWLEPNSKRLDFVTDVDWREDHKMLRVSFPTTVHAQEASFEIQYGFIRRPTHANTLWDHARFEVVGHRWADLSQRDYGVALLNDCKYGYKVRGHVLDLNLLRSPTEPDPIADRGRHRFTYSLLPHSGDLVSSDVLVHAAVLNQGLTLVAGVDASAAALPVHVEGDGIDLTVLKKAEETACLVVRLVESRGMRARGVLSARDPNARFVPTDLVEWNDDEARASTGSVALELSPFEIRTYKIFT